MTVVIENNAFNIPVAVAHVAVNLCDDEQKMLNEVDALAAHVKPDATYKIELVLFAGEVPGRTRVCSPVLASTLKEQLIETIKGHPEGFPKGPWPFAADVKQDSTEVRITLTEVSHV